MRGKLVLGLSIKSFEHDETEPFAPSLYLREGGTLEDYGIDAVVDELPGHTKGSIGIMAGQTDLIVGDALMNMLLPTKSMLYSDRSAMEESAAKIGSSQAATIHFGHGKSVANRTW